MEHKKDKRIEDLIKDNVFFGSALAMFVHKKISKISKAIYVITDILENSDPIRMSLREASVYLLKKDKKNVLDFFKDTALHIQNLRSLLELASFNRMVSEMNVSIISKECDSLLELMFEQKELSFLDVDKSFFYVNQERSSSRFLQIMETQRQSENKGHIKDNRNNMSFIKTKPSQDVEGVGSQEGVLNADRKDKEESPLPQQIDRKKKIIEIIKDFREVTIKDISNRIQDCSEKTIQRDLLDMVEKGQLKKEGERRWSRYSLV